MTKYGHISAIEFLEFAIRLTIYAHMILQHILDLTSGPVWKECYTTTFIQYASRLMSIRRQVSRYYCRYIVMSTDL